MTLVLDKFRSLLPKIKTSPSGWISFNAPCCHHRGHGHDTRKRGGVMFSDGVIYNCFNCKFSTSWQPGRPISDKFKSLCNWLGANQEDIKQLVFEALKTERLDYEPEHHVEKVKFTKKELPEATMTIAEWANSAYLPDIAEDLGKVIDYLINRGCDPMDSNFCWSPAPGFIDRVIIPFKYEGAVVGNTARKIKEGRPKYLSDQHPFFVFNVDQQVEENKYIFVCEGPFDALAVGGVALLTNEIGEQQAQIINSLGKEVIVVPDQDEAGLSLIDSAVKYNWSVAFPTWDNNIKDSSDAVKEYGKLFVIVDIIKTAQKGAIRIEVAKNNLETKIKLRSQDV